MMLALSAMALAVVPQQFVPETQTLTGPSSGQQAQIFGASVTCTRHTQNGGGYTVAIGAPGDDTAGTNAGAVYLVENGGPAAALARSDMFPTGDEFGQVALDRDTLVVGAWKDDAGGFSDIGSITVYTRNSSGVWTEEAVICATAFNGVGGFTLSDGDAFGAVAVHGERIVVGGRLADAGGFVDSGAAFIIEKTGSDWNSVTIKRLALDPMIAVPRAGDLFGSVAIYGDRAVVGARRYDEVDPCPNAVGGCDEGAVFVFERDSMMGNWNHAQVLRATRGSVTNPVSDTNVADEFGFSVALFHNILVVGSPGRDVGCGGIAQEENCDTGAVYVYEDMGAGFAHKTRLLVQGTFLDGALGMANFRRASIHERFGHSVSVDGSRIVVGGPGRNELIMDGSSLNTGAAYVYERNEAGAWTPTRFLSEYDLGGAGEHGAFFGSSVDAAASVIAVGAPLDASAGPLLGGRGYVFYQLPEFGISEHRTQCLGDRPSVCAPCPCSNNAASGEIGGCLNSTGGSVRLHATGRASITDDTLRFEAIGNVDQDTQVGLLAVAMTANPTAPPDCVGEGIATPLTLDGMRCLSGTVRVTSRMFTDCTSPAVCKTIGVESRGFGPPDGPPGGIMAFAEAAPGMMQVAGVTAHFQLFYRDLAWGSCSTLQNTSNSVSVTYVP